MWTLVLSVSSVIAMAHPVQAAMLTPNLLAMDRDLHEYVVSCTLMAIHGEGKTICLKNWRFRFESESLNIKSAWLPSEPLKIVLGSDGRGAPVLWMEFSAGRAGRPG